ncbi:MAG: amidase [Pseudomonadota bacterium]
MADELSQLGLRAAAEGIAAGRFSSEDLTRACLARIEKFDAEIEAWAYLDREHALAQARDADDQHRRGHEHGPLHGVPLGIKDIFDTKDMPTEDGTVLHAGRTPGYDAACVANLRSAGAVLMGKTVTAELATSTDSPKTRNPHNHERSPGGSSSGSAAAVASYMVPGATGTQTAGSVIRPAAFCGVYGYKPTFGLISRHRVLGISRTLDTVGSFARSLGDVALLAECMMGYDDRDPDMVNRARPSVAAASDETPPLPPRLAFVRTHVWDQADGECQEALAELKDALGDRIADIDLGATFATTHDTFQTICAVESAASLVREYDTGKDKLTPSVAALIEEGRSIAAVDYVGAKNRRADLDLLLDELFGDYDAVLTPAVTGVAPGLDSTGNSTFNRPWSLMGVPALNLPLLANEAGMPIGVQLVGARHHDVRLMRTARWLLNELDIDQAGDHS